MLVALGFWSITLGYALITTGVAWFIDSAHAITLGQNLGMKGDLIGGAPNIGSIIGGAADQGIHQATAVSQQGPSPVTSSNVSV